MADFARIVAAVDQVLGTNGYAHYVAMQGALASDSLTGDDFVAAIRRSVDDTFVGTSAELLRHVTPAAEDWRPPKGWPANATRGDHPSAPPGAGHAQGRLGRRRRRRRQPRQRRAVDDHAASERERHSNLVWLATLACTVHRPSRSLA